MTIGFGASDELAARERARSVAELQRAGFTRLDLAKLRPAGKFDVAGPDGRLWRRALGVRGEGRNVGLDAYAVDADGMVVWYEAPPASAAQTFAEFEAQQEQAQRMQAERDEQAAAVRESLRAQAVPVVLDDLLGDGVRLTLREAVAEVERAAGVVAVVEGRLVVSLPGSARTSTIGQPSPAMAAARRLYAAEGELISLAKGGKVAARSVPDRHVLPSGRVAP